MSDKKIPAPLKVSINKYPQLNEIVSFGYELFLELKMIQPNLDLSSLKLTHELINIKLKEGFPFLKGYELTEEIAGQILDVARTQSEQADKKDIE